LTYTTTQALGIGDIGNDNGVLTIAAGNADLPNPTNTLGAFIPAGSYQSSCSDISVSLKANCLNSNPTTFLTIENNNGVLTTVSMS